MALPDTAWWVPRASWFGLSRRLAGELVCPALLLVSSLKIFVLGSFLLSSPRNHHFSLI